MPTSYHTRNVLRTGCAALDDYVQKNSGALVPSPSELCVILSTGCAALPSRNSRAEIPEFFNNVGGFVIARSFRQVVHNVLSEWAAILWNVQDRSRSEIFIVPLQVSQNLLAAAMSKPPAKVDPTLTAAHPRGNPGGRFPRRFLIFA